MAYSAPDLRAKKAKSFQHSNFGANFLINAPMVGKETCIRNGCLAPVVAVQASGTVSPKRSFVGQR
jgi:hypothetical protein